MQEARWPSQKWGSDTSMEALRWAKQAEASGVARDHARFVEEIDRALQVALDAGAKTSNHRLAEAVHALMEARAFGQQGKLAEGREDVQSGHHLADPRSRASSSQPFSRLVHEPTRLNMIEGPVSPSRKGIPDGSFLN